MLIRLAWRNIFRNKRRSLITISSIIFAVLFAAFMRSIQFGAYDNMLKNVVGTYMGYLQVQQADFWNEKTIDNSYSLDALDGLDKLESITFFNPRIEGFALASHLEISKPAAVLGVDAATEQNTTQLHKKVISGAYFDKKKGLLIGKGLMQIMKLKLGDSLVLVGQGYQGSIANGSYPIIGIVDLVNPELNKHTILMNLDLAQDFFGLENRVTSAVIGAPNGNWQVAETELKKHLKEQDLAVMNWKQMLPELNELIIVDRAGGTFVLFILYGIITFGLFGTVLMLAEERRFEYGVLISVGMAKKKLIGIAMLETCLMALAGVTLGLVLAFPFILYFNINPINLSGQLREAVERFGFEALVPTSLDPIIALTQGLTVLIIVLVVNTYTIYKIKTLSPIKAMRR